MPNLQHRLVECYVFIDDYLQAHPDVADWRRSNNDEPDFTDAEVLTIALMQGYFRTDTLKRTYRLISQNASEAFPERPSYKQWIRRLNRLTDLVGRLVRAAALRAAATNLKRLYVVDSFPISLCQPVRHGRVRLLSEDGAYFGRVSQGVVLWIPNSRSHPSAHRRSAHCDAASG